MRHTIKIFFAALLFAGVFASCIEDKGNYTYDWVQSMRVEFAEFENNEGVAIDLGGIRRVLPRIEHRSGTVLTLTPVFIDRETDKAVEVDYDDYAFSWEALRGDRINQINGDDIIFLGDAYNLNTPILLASRPDNYLVTMRAVNKHTDQTYISQFLVRAVDFLVNGYFFMTEDASRNAEIDIYAYDADRNTVFMQNYLQTLGYEHRGGGANAITFDAFPSPGRLYFSTGEGFGWINPPDFGSVTVLSDPMPMQWLAFMQRPQTIETMVRVGGIQTTALNRRLYFMPPGGNLLHLMSPGSQNWTANLARRAGTSEETDLAPMIGGFWHNRTVAVWSNRFKRLGYLSVSNAAALSPGVILMDLPTAITKPIAECVYLGGCGITARQMIAVLKDADGGYWRVYMDSTLASNVYTPFYSEVKELPGAPGGIRHWINSHAAGHVYAVTDSEMWTYISSETGGASEDPGWTKATITVASATDVANAGAGVGGMAAGTAVTITDPITMVHFEDDGRNFMYIFTYDGTSGGGTLYMLRPRAGGVATELELHGMITGLGNVKKMAYFR